MADVKESTADLKLTPGLSALNLVILHRHDMHAIEDVKTDLLHSQKDEHPRVQIVQDVFLALLKTKLPKEQHESRHILENILKTHPNHLNALADLEKIYRDLYRIDDADSCKERYEAICKSNTPQDIEYKVECLLEQGFVLRTDKGLVNESCLLNQMKDMHCVIRNEHSRSENLKKEALSRSLDYLHRSMFKLEEAFKKSSIDGHVVRMRMSEVKFKQALSMHPLDKLHPAWQFQYAKTLNQLFNFLNGLPKAEKDKHMNDMIQTLIETITVFWNFTQHTCISFENNADLQRYIAQSYAYLGHIACRNESADFWAKIKECSILSEREFQSLIINPIAFHEKSVELFSGDVIVLSRYGRSLWLLSKQKKDKSEKKKILENALVQLTKAINKDDIGKRFSISTRMMILRDLAKISLQGTDEQKQYLKDAKEDGIACFKCMPSRRDMNDLANICQMLAKFPQIYDNGPDAVKSKDELYEALDYMHYGETLGEPVDTFSAYRIASCLFDLGEFEKALEWQQRTWSMWADKSICFPLLCVYLVTLMMKKGMDNNNVAKLLSFFLLGEKKYGKKDMMIVYVKVNKWSKGELLKTLDLIIKDPESISMDTREKNILIECLTVLRNEGIREDETLVTQLQEKLTAVIPVPEKEENITDIFCLPGRSSLPKAQEKAFSSQYTFDYFISYSNADSNYVHTVLVPFLETKFEDHDIPLKGCVASRDFQPGIQIQENIMRAIEKSEKVVFFLSNSFVTSAWCKTEMAQTIKKHLDTRGEGHVIPILYEECSIPFELSHLT